MGVESPLVALEGIERELGVYPALEGFEVVGLTRPCKIKIRMDGHSVGEERERTQEVVNELRSGVHRVGTPKGEMSGITGMMVEGKGSNNDHPGGIIGGERGSLVGGFGRLCEELDDFGASRVVFG